MSGSTISFTKYPAGQRTHGVFAEIDPQNTAGSEDQRTLIFGQMLGSGTAVANTVFQGTGLSDAKLECGVGSQLALMYQQYLGQDSFGEVWLAPQADDPAAIAATGTFTVTGTSTVAGTLSPYVAGVPVPVAVSAGSTATQAAASMAAAINANPNLPATAAAAAGVVTVTARNKGLVGNEIDLRLNFMGAAAGERTPAGLAVVAVTCAGGTQNPATAFAATLAMLNTKPFDFIVMPYTDSVSMNALLATLNDTVGRWSWQQEVFGCYFTAYRGTAGALTTFGLTRDEYQGNCLGFFDSPTPAWLWAADYAGASAVSLRADPALPLQELTLNVQAPPIASRFPLSVRNTNLFDGIGTFVVNHAGQVIIDRSITFYTTDASGAPDTTWLNTETPYSLVDLVRDMRTYLQATYGRKKLVADGSTISGGSNMVTSQTILAAVLARYKGYCDAGRAQNYAAFKAGAQAVNAGNGQVNLLLPFVLPSQLRQIVMKINFVANT